MKRKVTNYKPSSLWLENKRLGTFLLSFNEVRGDVHHQVRLHMDTGFIRLLAYRLGEQVQYAENEIANIKTTLREAGDGQ